MVASAFLLHDATRTVAREARLNINEYSLTEHELSAALKIRNALEPIVDISVRMKSTRVATLSVVRFELYQLYNEL